MNLAQLTYFCHLAKTEHYTRSAESLHVSQSALSHSISSLEKELGCRLFCKAGRNVQLTDDGRVFLKYVSEGLASIDRGIAEPRPQKQRPFRIHQRRRYRNGAIRLSSRSNAGFSFTIRRQNRVSCITGRNSAFESKARTGCMRPGNCGARS